MNRFAVPFVSLVGSVGLGLALAYLVLVVGAFAPGRPALTEFLVGTSDQRISFGFLVFLVPYVLLMTHLWMRARLGAWLLDRDDPDRAKRYAEKRTSANMLRGSKEALANRTVLLRVALLNGELERAVQIIEEARPLAGSDESSFSVDFHRWALEAALRVENLILANDLVDELEVPRERTAAAAAYCAAASELATRQRDELEAFEWLERADFASADHPRTTYARALALLQFRTDSRLLEQAVEELDRAAAFFERVPTALRERYAVEAELQLGLGSPDEAVAAIQRAEDAAADARSTFVASRVRERMATDSATLEEEE